MSATKTVRERKRAAVLVTLTVSPKTGAWSIATDDGTEVASGEWTKDGAKRALRVPLGYDASAYFDSLVDRRRGHLRAEKLRATLEEIDGAKTIAEARALARAALSDVFEMSVRAEQADAAEGA